MFGLGFGEIVVIMLVALIVFGPERLPSIAKTLGRSAAQFRRAVDDFKREVNLSDMNLDPILRNDPPRRAVVHIPNPPEEKANSATCESEATGTVAPKAPEPASETSPPEKSLDKPTI